MKFVQLATAAILLTGSTTGHRLTTLTTHQSKELSEAISKIESSVDQLEEAQENEDDKFIGGLYNAIRAQLSVLRNLKHRFNL